eukprot:EG_transcript_7947
MLTLCRFTRGGLPCEGLEFPLSDLPHRPRLPQGRDPPEAVAPKKMVSGGDAGPLRDVDTRLLTPPRLGTAAQSSFLPASSRAAHRRAKARMLFAAPQDNGPAAPCRAFDDLPDRLSVFGKHCPVRLLTTFMGARALQAELSGAGRGCGLAPDVVHHVFLFLAGPAALNREREQRRDMRSTHRSLKERLVALQDTVHCVLDGAGLFPATTVAAGPPTTHPALALPLHPFDVLRAVHTRVPSIASLTQLLVVDLQAVVGMIFDPLERGLDLVPYLTAQGLFHEAVAPALRLALGLTTWKVGVPVDFLPPALRAKMMAML